MMESKFMLTTVDNPFNPFEQFASWLMFDIGKGYNSCAYLARIANPTDDMSDQEIDAEIERAIDEIIKYDFADLYRKVKKEVSDDQESLDEESKED